MSESERLGPVLPGAGASDYERYLRTDELLSLQKPAQEAVHHDELLFQVVHQTSELWLKLASAEVEAATELLLAADSGGAARLLRRASLCLGYVTGSLDMLEQMSPWEYQQIRVVLGHGSGFDSPGFRGVHAVSRRAFGAFERLLEQAEIDLVELYRRGREFESLHTIAELLSDWDERLWLWRLRHYAVVVRSIGEDTTGTQGTPVAVLGRLVAQRQLPELWRVRNELVAQFDAERDSDGG